MEPPIDLQITPNFLLDYEYAPEPVQELVKELCNFIQEDSSEWTRRVSSNCKSHPGRSSSVFHGHHVFGGMHLSVEFDFEQVSGRGELRAAQQRVTLKRILYQGPGRNPGWMRVRPA